MSSVPARRRSRFIAEAIEERLAIEEQLTALEESAGAWTDANHPELRTEADVDNWVRELRASFVLISTAKRQISPAI